MKLLTFHLEGTAYALPLDAVAEVLAAPALRRVPASPPSVLGVAEAGGRIVAVLDLGYLLDSPGTRETRHLVRLATPHERSAFAIGPPIRTGSGEASGPGEVTIHGAPHVLLDPVRLLQRAAGA